MEQTIAYRFGPQDYIAVLRASRSVGRLGRWGRALLFGLLIAGAAIAFGGSSLHDAPGAALIAGAVVLVVVTLLAPIGEYLGERLMARWWFPRYSVANKDVTLELGDQDLRSRVGENEGRISWGSIVRIIETEDGLFLALSRAELLAVPRRALPSAEAFASLARELRAKVGASAAG
jgi:hypothetical protein